MKLVKKDYCFSIGQLWEKFEINIKLATKGCSRQVNDCCSNIRQQIDKYDVIIFFLKVTVFCESEKDFGRIFCKKFVGPNFCRTIIDIFVDAMKLKNAKF